MTDTDRLDVAGPLAFVDTETTSLDRRTAEVWEVAIVRRDPDGTTSSYEARWWPDLRHADPRSLAMNGFYDRAGRRPVHRFDADADGPDWTHTDLTAIAENVRALTDGASLVGMVPSFDEHHLDRFLRGWNLVPTWHYHPIDVEALAAGHLGALPPYRSADLSRALGIDPDDYDRHTAMGDVRWTLALWDALHDGGVYVEGTVETIDVSTLDPFDETLRTSVRLRALAERIEVPATVALLDEAADELDRTGR